MGIGSKGFIRGVLKHFTLALFVLMVSVLRSPAETKVARYLKGNAADVNPSLAGPAHDFSGGTDVPGFLTTIPQSLMKPRLTVK
jgi:hypothetical protein